MDGGCGQQEMNVRDSDVTRLAGALAEGAMQLLQWTPVCCDERSIECTEAPEQSRGARQVAGQEEYGLEKPTTRTAPPVPSPFSQIRRRMSFSFDPLKVET